MKTLNYLFFELPRTWRNMPMKSRQFFISQCCENLVLNRREERQMKSTGQVTTGWLMGMIILSLIGMFPLQTRAADLYVSMNGSNSGAHDSWATAFTNVQDALNAAGPGDVIYLAGQTFQVTNQLVWSSRTNVTLRGGYAATNNEALPGDYDVKRWPTILTRGSAFQTRILLITNVSASLVERVTICGGYQSNVASGFGGGLYIVGAVGLVLSDCVLTNNTVAGNNSSVYGAAIYSKSSTLTITQRFPIMGVFG
jgi:hypothetical protein